MLMVSGQQLCRIICVKKYASSSARKLGIFLYRGAILSTKCQWMGCDDKC